MIRYPYRKHNKKSGAGKNNGNSPRYLKIDTCLETNLQQIKKLTSDSPDFLMRRFKLGLRAEVPAAIVFLDSMAKTDTVNELIMRSMLSRPSAEVAAEAENAEALYVRIQSHALALGEVKDCDDWSSMMEQLLMGTRSSYWKAAKKRLRAARVGERHAQSASQQHRQSSEDRKRDL